MASMMILREMYLRSLLRNISKNGFYNIIILRVTYKMDHKSLKRFIEQVYCMEFNPSHIIEEISNKMDDKVYFIYRPFESGFLQTEFYYDKNTNRLFRVNNIVDWDPMFEDTFS